MYLRLCLALLLVCGSLGLFGSADRSRREALVLHRERLRLRDDDLRGASQGRVPRDQSRPETSWYIVYIEFNADLDRVFIDTYSPSSLS
jgi:hypothetical protein